MLQPSQRETPSGFQGKVDDVSNDAAAAYAEVLERTARETVEPAGRNGRTSQAGEPEPSGKGVADKAAPATAKVTKTADVPADDKRDDKGRFKPTEKVIADPAQKPAEADAKGEGEQKADDKPVAAVEGAPPQSWSVKSKAAWEKLPPEVRADAIKREGEVQQGLAALKDYKDLKPWAEMAQKHNTTIGKALEHYTGLENLMRQDLGRGMRIIAQNFGLNQEQAAQFFAKMAADLSGGKATAPAGPGQTEPDNALMEALRPVLGPVMQEISQLRGQVSAFGQAEKSAQSNTLAKAIELFAADPVNKFFANVEETVTRLFETKMVPLTGDHKADLQKAYDLATRMTPDVQEALIEQRLEETRQAERKAEQERVDKAKGASRSLTGSRQPGTIVKDRAEMPPGHDDVEEDVRRAYRLLSQT